VFSQARFLWQRLRFGKPGDMFGTADLNRLERPWVGGTTGDLLGQMILHADFAGNAYVYEADDGDLGLLRPDWTDIVLEQRMANGRPAGFRRVGYVYYDGGQRDRTPTVFLAGEVAHFAPMPDPMASYRGMSWLSPIISDLTSDKAANSHRQSVYENAATPNLAVSLAADVSPEAFEAFVDKMDAQHKGIQNAGKTLYLGGGADVRAKNIRHAPQ
jgi:phage portal protein BeeE